MEPSVNELFPREDGRFHKMLYDLSKIVCFNHFFLERGRSHIDIRISHLIQHFLAKNCSIIGWITMYIIYFTSVLLRAEVFILLCPLLYWLPRKNLFKWITTMYICSKITQITFIWNKQCELIFFLSFGKHTCDILLLFV